MPAVNKSSKQQAKQARKAEKEARKVQRDTFRAEREERRQLRAAAMAGGEAAAAGSGAATAGPAPPEVHEVAPDVAVAAPEIPDAAPVEQPVAADAVEEAAGPADEDAAAADTVAAAAGIAEETAAPVADTVVTAAAIAETAAPAAAIAEETETAPVAAADTVVAAAGIAEQPVEAPDRLEQQEVPPQLQIEGPNAAPVDSVAPKDSTIEAGQLNFEDVMDEVEGSSSLQDGTQPPTPQAPAPPRSPLTIDRSDPDVAMAMSILRKRLGKTPSAAEVQLLVAPTPGVSARGTPKHRPWPAMPASWLGRPVPASSDAAKAGEAAAPPPAAAVAAAEPAPAAAAAAAVPAPAAAEGGAAAKAGGRELQGPEPACREPAAVHAAQPEAQAAPSKVNADAANGDVAGAAAAPPAPAAAAAAAPAETIAELAAAPGHEQLHGAAATAGRPGSSSDAVVDTAATAGQSSSDTTVVVLDAAATAGSADVTAIITPPPGPWPMDGLREDAEDDDREDAWRSSYIMKPDDKAHVLATEGSAFLLDPRCRERLRKGITRTAGKKIIAAWERCGADVTGRLELLFLQAWARDPSLGVLRMLEQNVHEASQSKGVVLKWFTYHELEQRWGPADAAKLAATAFQVAPHVQDRSIKWYQCIDTAETAKHERHGQKRALEVEGYGRDSLAAALAAVSFKPGHGMEVRPAPGWQATAKAGAGEPSAKAGAKRTKKKPEDSTEKKLSKMRDQVEKAINRSNSVLQEIEKSGTTDPIDKGLLESLEVTLRALKDAFGKVTALHQTFITGSGTLDPAELKVIEEQVPTLLEQLEPKFQLFNRRNKKAKGSRK